MIFEVPFEVLLVDDDAGFLNDLVQFIEPMDGFRFHRAAGALEAMIHLQKHKTHVLITDTNMPGMNGLDLLIKALGHDPDLKVIVLFSGLEGSKITAEQILALGAHRVFPKIEINSQLVPALLDLLT